MIIFAFCTGVFVDPGYNSYQKISLLGLLEAATGIFSRFFSALEWSHRRAPIPMFFGVLLAALVILDLASHRPDVFSCRAADEQQWRKG